MPSSYTTTQGDTWDTIARKLWGKEAMCSALMAANPMHVGAVVFPAGVVLTVPDVEVTATVVTPPWRTS